MKRSIEIEAITRRFIAGGSDIETMRRVYSDSADLIAVGSDDGWAHGPAEVLGVLEYEEVEFEAVDYDSEEVFLDAFENGETGWSVGELRVTLADDQRRTPPHRDHPSTHPPRRTSTGFD
jgi:hypothetical protein